MVLVGDGGMPSEGESSAQSGTTRRALGVGSAGEYRLERDIVVD